MNGLTITIKNQDGKWLINGKNYSECEPIERNFFDRFIQELKYKS